MMNDHKKMFILIIFMLVIVVSSVAFANDTKSIHYYSKPESIIHEIKSRGANAVVSELYSDLNVWHSILQKIATGNQSWLEVAVALRAGSDAGASEMLTLAVGEALQNNPKHVFTIAAKAFELRNICSGPDVDDERYNSYELSMKEIDRRIEKIKVVKDRSMEKISKECIQYLEASKKGISDFYGIKNK